MTYCVGLCVDEGVVMLSDTRTNAGLDNISTFSKMHVVESPGERALVLMTAGNLAITQTVWNLLQQGIWVEGVHLRPPRHRQRLGSCCARYSAQGEPA